MQYPTVRQTPGEQTQNPAAQISTFLLVAAANLLDGDLMMSVSNYILNIKFVLETMLRSPQIV